VRVNATDDDTRIETLDFSVQQAEAKDASDLQLGVVTPIRHVVLPNGIDVYTLMLPRCAGRTQLVATVRDSANRVKTASIANIVCDNTAPPFTRFVATSFQDHAAGSVSFSPAGGYVHGGSTSATIDPNTLLDATGLRFTTFIDLAGDVSHVPNLLISNPYPAADPVFVDYAFSPHGMSSPPLGWQAARLMRGEDVSRAEIVLTVDVLCGKNLLCQEGLIKRLPSEKCHTLKIRMRDAAGNVSEEKSVRVFSNYRFPPVRVRDTQWTSPLSSLGISSSYLFEHLFAFGRDRYAPFVEHTVDFPVPPSSGWLPSVIALRTSGHGSPFVARLNEYRVGPEPVVIESQLNQTKTPCAGTGSLGDHWQLSDASGTTWASCTSSRVLPNIVVKSKSGRPSVHTEQRSKVCARDWGSGPPEPLLRIV
jgi:hypothetical protein